MIQVVLVKSYDRNRYARQLQVRQFLEKLSGFLLYKTPKGFIFFPYSLEALRKKVHWNILGFDDLSRRRLILFLVY